MLQVYEVTLFYTGSFSFKPGFLKVGQVAPSGVMTGIQGAMTSKGAKGGHEQ